MGILEEGGTDFDPNVPDAFNTIAETIYRDLANREDEGLKDELVSIRKERLSPRRKDRKVITHCCKCGLDCVLGDFAPLRE